VIYRKQDSAMMDRDDLAAAYEAGFVAGIHAAAEVARPPLAHRAGPPGLWRRRRQAIAEAILALRPARLSRSPVLQLQQDGKE
jgi:hypothetical protein